MSTMGCCCVYRHSLNVETGSVACAPAPMKDGALRPGGAGPAMAQVLAQAASGGAAGGGGSPRRRPAASTADDDGGFEYYAYSVTK